MARPSISARARTASSCRARWTSWREIYAANPTATLVSGATDVGLWVTKFMRDIGPMIYIGHLQELHSIEETDGERDLRRGRDLHRGRGRDRAALSATGGAVGPHRRRAGAQCRARSAPISPMARRSAIRRRRSLRWARTIILRKGERAARGEARAISSSPTASRTGSRASSSRASRSRTCPRASSSPATRSPSARTRTFRRSAGRSASSSTTAAWCGWRASRSAAWRRRRSGRGRWKRRWSASPGHMRRSRRRSRRLPMDYQPLTDMRASAEYRLLAAQNLLRRFHLETTGDGERLSRAVA